MTIKQWIGVFLMFLTVIIYFAPGVFDFSSILNTELTQQQINFIVITLFFIGVGLLFIGEESKKEDQGEIKMVVLQSKQVGGSHQKVTIKPPTPNKQSNKQEQTKKKDNDSRKETKPDNKSDTTHTSRKQIDHSPQKRQIHLNIRQNV